VLHSLVEPRLGNQSAKLGSPLRKGQAALAQLTSPMRYSYGLLPSRTAGEVQRGFGLSLLERVLTMQANADVQVADDGVGLIVRMEAPLIGRRLVPEYRRRRRATSRAAS